MDILTEGGSLIHNRDYTILIDGSQGMQPNFTGADELWSVVKGAAVKLADECESLDYDGLSLYLYAEDFQRFDQVSAGQLSTQLNQYVPSGKANLAPVLRHATANYFNRRAQGVTKFNGETLLVLTASLPQDMEEVRQVLIEVSQQMHRDEEIGISFIQVVVNEAIQQYFGSLDDDLIAFGAKFDLCDSVTLATMEQTLLAETLLNALVD